MTESEWLVAANPLSLLMYAKRTAVTLRTAAGRRKFRLFGVGCVRRVWPAFRQIAQRTAVEVAERFADGEGTQDGMWDAWTRCRQSFAPGASRARQEAIFGLCRPETWEAVKVWRVTCGSEFDGVRGNKPAAEKKQLAALARCTFGNPFRPVAVDPSWLTSTVVALSRGIYDDRAFDRLPILADALQDAGCDNLDVLNHCRGDGPHARGCWVVDLLLGKT
jgi:hypothetical protein